MKAEELKNTISGRTAYKFALYLTENNFSEAHKLLSDSLKKDFSPQKLQENYQSMIEYGESPVSLVEVMNIMTEWKLPEQKKDDIGCVYVAIAGDDWSEAVNVIVTEENGQHLISDIEWGRP